MVLCRTRNAETLVRFKLEAFFGEKLIEQKIYRIGVVGYSGQKFDYRAASSYITKAFNKIVETNFDIKTETKYIVVSGLTNLGIPRLAYEEAVVRSWDTWGIACAKATDYPCFPVTEKIIVGTEWGDESNALLYNIDILVRVGGGPQSKVEIAKARIRGMKVMEFNLDATK